MTDRQWEAQNSTLHPDIRRARCGDKGALFTAFRSEHVKVTCPSCKGTGKASPN